MDYWNARHSGPENYSDFPSSILTGPQQVVFGKCVKFVLSPGKQSNCVMLPLGNQESAPSRPQSDQFMPQGCLTLVKLSQLVGLDLPTSFFGEHLILVGNLYQLSASICIMQELCRIISCASETCFVPTNKYFFLLTVRPTNSEKHYDI